MEERHCSWMKFWPSFGECASLYVQTLWPASQRQSAVISTPFLKVWDLRKCARVGAGCRFQGEGVPLVSFLVLS